jgi:ankyrin repeat protein
VYNCHYSVVQYLIEIAKADINFAEFNKGLTPLSVACATGHLELAQYLVQKGASVETREITGCTPFVIACGCGHLDIVKYLVLVGVDTMVANNDGFTALFAAAGAGHMDVVTFLLTQGAEVNRKSNKGSTALYIACANGHLDIVRVLTYASADLDSRDNKGLTPLHAAVGSPKSSLFVFSFLIQRGADITAKDSRNKLALDYAKREPLESLKAIISPIWHETLVHKLVYENDLVSLQQLLDLDGFDYVADSRGRDSWTPLHIAAFFDRSEAAKLLILSGADSFACSSSEEQTPMHIAAARNSVPTLRTIICSHAKKTSKGNRNF